MIKYIIFDMMGVIFTVGDDTNDLLVPFVWKKNPNITREKINHFYKEASLGRISSHDFWKSVEIDSFANNHILDRAYLDECLTFDEDFMKIAEWINRKYKIAILSNDLKEWSVYLRTKYDIDSVVDFSIISGDVCFRKPSEEIYKIVLGKASVDPSECLFIDDRDKNLLPALKMGMNVIKFSREEHNSIIDGIQVVNNFYELKDAIDQISTL